MHGFDTSYRNPIESTCLFWSVTVTVMLVRLGCWSLFVITGLRHVKVRMKIPYANNPTRTIVAAYWWRGGTSSHVSSEDACAAFYSDTNARARVVWIIMSTALPMKGSVESVFTAYKQHWMYSTRPVQRFRVPSWSKTKKKKLRDLLSASELYRSSDCRLSAKLVPTLADRGCQVVSATNPHGR
jgi:hypothetical protein